ncbi:Serine/threonine-protein kinase 16 [Cichlidogyrus casuarinus]|uniref:non-specific serine/threonine protein kinase n=1 Tax=Cichlidogyrus casuarinus TaxID=1844966 RepID=A0ABD2PWX5_9PLAT
MRNGEMEPILIDFGSVTEARIQVDNCNVNKWRDFVEENTSMTYRAPELFSIVSGQKITESSDCWSLGCILYACCYFKGPFDQVYARNDSVALAVTSPVILPSQLNYRVPEWLELILNKFLHIQPENRPTFIELKEIFSFHVKPFSII